MNLDTYRDLFVHRSDVYAEQQSTGMYFPVGTTHWDPEAKKVTYDSYYPLTDDELDEHLGGQASYGVYVIDPTPDTETFGNGVVSGNNGVLGNPVANSVKYVVFDLDTYDEAAWLWLKQCIYELVVSVDDENFGGPYKYAKCLLAENSGGKGYHVWLFLSEPVPAAKVRRWIARDFLPLWNVNSASFPGSPLEIFPKQDAVPTLGGFGNLVKLPLGVHAVSGNKSEFLPCEGWASGIDNVQKLDASLIPEISTEPLPRRDGTPRSVSNRPRTTGATESGSTPFACISRIIEDGAPAGNRDNAMFHFARYAAGAGIPEDLVIEWCSRVNEEFSPPLSEREVATKVRSAFAMESPHPGCNADWLKGFCPGGEHCFAPWNEERANHKPSVDDGQDYLALSPHERRLLRGNA